MADKKDVVWRVTHPQCGMAIVVAKDWKLATVAAAEWWEVPWGRVAAGCEVEKIGDIVHNVCIDCGKIFCGEGLRCELCESKAKTAAANKAAAGRRWWREMRPK